MKRVLLIGLAMLLTSCGPKTAKTQASLQFVSSFSNIAGALSAGGAVVHGVNEDTGETFTIFPQANGESIELNSNTWSFYAIAWEGPNKLEGTLRCGTTTVSLAGGEETVGLTLTALGCNDAAMFDTTAFNGDQPLPVRFGNCDNISGISSGTDNCTDNLGSFASYRITLFAQGVGAGLYPPLQSECINEAGLLSGLTNTNLKIPMTTFAQDFLSLEVQAYDLPACGGALTLFNSTQALVSLAPNAAVFNDPTYTTLYLRKVVPNFTIGALPFTAPISSGSLTSTNFKANIKIQPITKNKEAATSTNFKLLKTSSPYPEKAQQKSSANFKMILGN